MSFVGTRPEVVKYVKKYKPEYFATLLLPAGITSEASIKYKDEAELLDAAEDVDEVYITKVLPEKPIINPFEQNPQDYFCIKHYRYYSKNSEVEEIARRTIGVLELNDTENVVMLRFKVGEMLKT